MRGKTLRETRARWGAVSAAVLPALLLMVLGGCARRCETTPSGYERCEYEDICAEDPPECKSKIEPGRMEIQVSKPLPVRVEIYRGRRLESAEKVQTLFPLSEMTLASLSGGEYVLTALYVNGGDSTLVVATGEMEQDELFLCSRKTCYEYERSEVDLRLK